MKDQVVGDFQTKLEVTDMLGPGAPDMANIKVISPNDYTGMMLADVTIVLRQLNR